MLGRRHQRARLIAEDGGEFGSGNGVNVGADLALAALFKAGTNESDAGIGFRGMQDEGHREPGMNPDTAQYGLIAKRRLPSDLHTPVPPTRTPMPRPAIRDSQWSR